MGMDCRAALAMTGMGRLRITRLPRHREAAGRGDPWWMNQRRGLPRGARNDGIGAPRNDGIGAPRNDGQRQSQGWA